DKDTSGILVLGKNPGAMLALMAQFQERTVEKSYICLVHGLFKQDSDTIRLPLGRSTHNRQRFAVVAEGRPAETNFRVQQRFTFNSDKFLEVVQNTAGEKKAKEFPARIDLYEG